MNAFAQFFDGLAPLTQAIGQIFETVNQSDYQKYVRTCRDNLLTAHPMKVYTSSERACFMRVAISRKSQDGPHEDRTDFPDGWAAMCCFGDFTGGTLCLPDIDIKGKGVQIAYKPGNVLFVQSATEHFVSPFEGERSGIVCFSNAKV